MRKNLLVILALLWGITTLHAKPVDVGNAQRLGLNFIQNKALFAKNAVNHMNLAYTCHADNGMATAYVFNFNGGFVIVAADDVSSPILGYSDQGNFDYESAPDGLRFMLGETSRSIESMVEQGITATNDILCRWKNLEEYGMMHPEKGTAVVEPLVQQKWNQDYPYNMYAPGGCPTGCVATAMAQLMKYWEWPIQGTGEHGYDAFGYGTQYANFGETTYDWANMIDSYSIGSPTQEQKVAVATLMYHCGVSVNMMYEPSGSGAYSADVPVAINTYFSYSDHATHIPRVGSYDDWIALLKSNIDQHIPVYYSGQSSEGGHAFICDGYDADGLFHFNWGWGGASNNYFLIDGEHFDYSGSQAIVYDFIPDYIYKQMPKAVENLAVTIDDDFSLTGHLSWTNPTQTEAGESLESLSKVIVKRNGFVVHEIEDVRPGQNMSCDDEVSFFDQYEYTVIAVADGNYGRTALTKAVFGPYCDWKVIMTSQSMQGWDGGGITVQNAAGSYIDFLTTTQATATIQTFQMALGNNNLYWTAPNSNITNLSFKIKDAENQVVYEYNGPSSGLEPGLIRTLNNSCGNENTCEAPYNLIASVDPDNDQTIILKWDSDHTPEFGYCIYRDGFLFNMAHDTQYMDENTNIGGHCYYVTALCNGGETVNSNEYCITSGPDCEPPADLYFSYTNNKVQLNWSASENPTVSGYTIYRKTEGTDYKFLKAVRNTNYKDMTATANTTYRYAVVASYQAIDCNSAYATSLVNPDKYYVEVDWSSRPKDLRATLNETDSVVSLHWTPAYQATIYKIMRNGLGIGETTEVEFVDENLEAGETYCYQVVALGEGFEEHSNEVCVTTPEAPEPPVLPCSAPTNLFGDFRSGLEFSSAIHIGWLAPEDRVPDSYTLIAIDMLGGNDTTIVTGITETFYEEIHVTDGTDRIFQVKAVYPECESEFALTANGEDFVRLTDLSVNECQMNVKLYPNPASSQVTIEAEGIISVSVYDFIGQCLMESIVREDHTTIDLSHLQSGVYFVKVSTQNGSVIQKVVKM